jgi:photoactive yellow protein
VIDVHDSLTDTAWDQAGRLALAGAGLVPNDVLARLATMSSAELGELDLGAVRLDDAGLVDSINAAALDLAAVTPIDALGHDFFTELAPCTNNRLFRGLFRRGVAEGAMNLVFFYTFTYRLSPTEVKVHMYRTESGQNWILVRRR